MAHKDKNYLSEKALELLRAHAPGKLLEAGAGDGVLSNEFANLGFEVIACDLNEKRFKNRAPNITFRAIDLNRSLPFEDNLFDYIACLEVIEHLENPHFLIAEFGRVLKNNGLLVISTPNILNLKSRLRFLFEGSYEYFRKPPSEHINDSFDLHITPLRFHELEYILFKNEFKIEEVTTSYLMRWLNILYPLKTLIKKQMWSKYKRVKKKSGFDYSRIYKILLSDSLLLGKHLVIKARQLKSR